MLNFLLRLFGSHGVTEIGYTDEEVSPRISHLK